jgi:hypothetical protein
MTALSSLALWKGVALNQSSPAPVPPVGRHVIQFSGGIGSAAAALRVAEEHGTDAMHLLIADTKIEDEDLWRFAADVQAYLDVPLTVVADGRTPWEVFSDVGFIGNSRLAPCSLHLKQRPCRRWLEKHADPATTTVYVGIDWYERHRTPAIVHGWRPWQVRFPMCEEPHLTKDDMMALVRGAGIRPPRMYAYGYAHNNCGGTCVRAGQRQWDLTRRTFPDRYERAEREERQLRERLGDYAILRERSKRRSGPLTLEALRLRREAAERDAA